MNSFKLNGIEEGEEIITNLYEHWVVLFKPLFALLIGSAVFGFLIALAYGFYENGLINWAAGVVLIAVAAFWLVLHWVFIFIFQWVVSDWYVTTKRLIEFELLVFVKHDLSYVHIDRIHEIEQHQHGVLANLLNYGHVRLNLAAIVNSKDLKYLPQPSKFVGLIEHLQDVPEVTLDVEGLRKKYRY